MSIIYCFGYPKSGTTYLSRLLGDILNSPVGCAYAPADDSCIATEGKNRKGKHYIRQGHSIPVDNMESNLVIPVMGQLAYKNLTNERVIYMTRDPRDIVVSAKHHWGNSIADTIRLAFAGEFPLDWGGGFIPYLKAWEDAPFNYYTTTYEDLLTNTLKETRKLLRGILHLPIHTRRAIHRQSFAVRKKWTKEHGEDLTYGRTFQYNFLRRGQIGSWRDEMDVESRELMQEYFGDWLLSHGYITGPEWIKNECR